MFISLNKKFIYAICSFFIITSIVFLYAFYQIYGLQVQEELQNNISRNQEYINLLYENKNLKKELQKTSSQNTKTENEKEVEKAINIEKKRIAKLQENYNNRYASLQEGIKIIGVSSILIIFALGLLWFLIKYWVLNPLEILSTVSQKIIKGSVNHRANLNKKRLFLDETDILIQTFNTMLDTIENNLKEIKNTENFLQNIIDGIPDGLRVIDTNYNVIIANKEYYKQVGNTRQHLKCYEATQNRHSPCNTKIQRCPLKEILNKNKQHMHIVQQFDKYPEKPLYINAAPIEIENKKFIIEVIRDLSEDIEFSHQQKLSSLGFMSTSIAHEMKNHLGAIRIILECLLDKHYKNIDESEESKKLLQLIKQQIIETIMVPERLLKLSQNTQEDNEIINCSNNIKDIVQLMDYEAKNKGINIELKTEKEFEIKGNANDFKMAIINLISNAIKACLTNGKIEIILKEDKKYHIIEIKDNGKGISKKNLPHIFEPFYSEGKEGNTKGTGLGLAIVKSITEKLKGKIEVESKINVGTCFSLKFLKTNTKINCQNKNIELYKKKNNKKT